MNKAIAEIGRERNCPRTASIDGGSFAVFFVFFPFLCVSLIAEEVCLTFTHVCAPRPQHPQGSRYRYSSAPPPGPRILDILLRSLAKPVQLARPRQHVNRYLAVFFFRGPLPSRTNICICLRKGLGRQQRVVEYA